MCIDARWSILASVVLVACSTTPAVVEKPVPGTVFPAGDSYLHIAAVAPGYAGREPADRRWLIYLEGIIDNGATARLERLLDREQIRSAVVYFDSPGGHVVEAMALGRMIRQRGYATSVDARPTGGAQRPGRCYSACPVAFAGGVHRSLAAGSVLGVHRARNSVPVPDEAAFQGVVTRQLRDYLAAMGVSPEFVTLMSEVPNDTIRDLTADEDVRLGLVNVSARF
jgi:hypothetical protein